MRRFDCGTTLTLGRCLCRSQTHVSKLEASLKEAEDRLEVADKKVAAADKTGDNAKLLLAQVRVCGGHR